MVDAELGIGVMSPQLEDIVNAFEVYNEPEAAAYLLSHDWEKYNKLKGEGFPEQLWKDINTLRVEYSKNEDFKNYWNDLMEEYVKKEKQ